MYIYKKNNNIIKFLFFILFISFTQFGYAQSGVATGIPITGDINVGSTIRVEGGEIEWLGGSSYKINLKVGHKEPHLIKLNRDDCEVGFFTTNGDGIYVEVKSVEYIGNCKEGEVSDKGCKVAIVVELPTYNNTGYTSYEVWVPYTDALKKDERILYFKDYMPELAVHGELKMVSPKLGKYEITVTNISREMVVLTEPSLSSSCMRLNESFKAGNLNPGDDNKFVLFMDIGDENAECEGDITIIYHTLDENGNAKDSKKLPFPVGANHQEINSWWNWKTAGVVAAVGLAGNMLHKRHNVTISTGGGFPPDDGSGRGGGEHNTQAPAPAQAPTAQPLLPLVPLAQVPAQAQALANALVPAQDPLAPAPAPAVPDPLAQEARANAEALAARQAQEAQALADLAAQAQEARAQARTHRLTKDKNLARARRAHLRANRAAQEDKTQDVTMTPVQNVVIGHKRTHDELEEPSEEGDGGRTSPLAQALVPTPLAQLAQPPDEAMTLAGDGGRTSPFEYGYEDGDEMLSSESDGKIPKDHPKQVRRPKRARVTPIPINVPLYDATPEENFQVIQLLRSNGVSTTESGKFILRGLKGLLSREGYEKMYNQILQQIREEKKRLSNGFTSNFLGYPKSPPSPGGGSGGLGGAISVSTS